MLRRLRVATALAALLSASSALGAEALRWFPLEPGNEWRFTDGRSGVKTIRCEGQGGVWFKVSGLFDGDRWLAYHHLWGDVLWLWKEPAGPAWNMIRFGGSLSTWDFDLTDGAGDRLEARWGRTAQVWTPAHRFEGCRELVLASLADAGAARAPVIPWVAAIWFADGVGPVRLVSTTGRVFDLIGAKVGATTYPRPNAPTIAAPATLRVNAGESVWFRVDARDGKGRATAAAVESGMPASHRASFFPSDGNLLVFRPTEAEIGAHAVTFVVRDGALEARATTRIDVLPAIPWDQGLAAGRVRLAADLSVRCRRTKWNALGRTHDLDGEEVTVPLRFELGGTHPGALTVRIRDDDRTFPAEAIATVAADGTFWFSGGPWDTVRQAGNTISGNGRIVNGRVVIERFSKAWQNGIYYLHSFPGDDQPYYSLDYEALDPDTRATLRANTANLGAWER